jgi:predicted aldo/keto reductase-like oxidoreductase
MQNRRGFLKNSLLTVSGAGLAFGSLPGSLPGQESLLEDFKMVYRTLGKTGIRLPVISMGTGNTNNPNLVRAALDKGVKLLATGATYQNGKNEEMVGSVLKDRPRDSYLIMTSSVDINWIDTRTGVFKDDFNEKEFLESVDRSLERLQVDYVDIFTQPFAATRESLYYEPARKAMEAVKNSGKARFLGIATHKLEHEAIRAAVDVGLYDVVMTAYNFRRKGWYSEQNGGELDEAIQHAAESGLGIIAMKTMAGVYWDKKRTKPINATAALKWVLQNENIHTSVPDCSTYDHLDQDLAIMANPELTEEEKMDLKPPSEDVSSGLYCQQCNRCIPQCPEALDIPTIMRSYMYAYGYKNLEFARKTLSSAGLSSNPCDDCKSCTVNCTMGFNVKSRIMDIARVQEIPEDLII